jgi:hypothetical protein
MQWVPRRVRETAYAATPSKNLQLVPKKHVSGGKKHFSGVRTR